MRLQCNCQIYKEANWQTHTDGEITNPYMRAGRAEQPGGDDETKTLTHRRVPVTTEALLKVSDICLLVLLFFFLDAQIAQWVKTGRAPRSAEAEYVHFLFPKPFLLTDRSTFFFFLGILSLLFSFFLSFSVFLSLQKLFSPLVCVNSCPPFCIQQVKLTCKKLEVIQKQCKVVFLSPLFTWF